MYELQINYNTCAKCSVNVLYRSEEHTERKIVTNSTCLCLQREAFYRVREIT